MPEEVDYATEARMCEAFDAQRGKDIDDIAVNLNKGADDGLKE